VRGLAAHQIQNYPRLCDVPVDAKREPRWSPSTLELLDPLGGVGEAGRVMFSPWAFGAEAGLLTHSPASGRVEPTMRCKLVAVVAVGGAADEGKRGVERSGNTRFEDEFVFTSVI